MQRLDQTGEEHEGGGLCIIYLYYNVLILCPSERMGESHVASVSAFCKALLSTMDVVEPQKRAPGRKT